MPDPTPTATDPSPAASRDPLSRERALAAAVALADAEGIAALSMRRLARELGVEAMSLYHHVANKSDILDGMVDAVFGEVELPPEGAAWRDAMRRRAASMRTVLARHPWAIGLMDSRTSPGPATLRHHDAVIGCCRTAGLTVAMSAHAVSLIDSYVYGFALQEAALPFQDGDDLTGLVDTILPPAFRDTYPHLAELTAEHVLAPGYSHGAEFLFGLDLVLDGLAARAGI
ncbi:TetR/AcrR family transcriptional regulator C-terminal domain-containing protein [Paraconexibacter sp.]|uniref:TetR/AcrR family transcriptional regulator C-terminal domain-containing protein n=1 Tax=Paraconexibacter sp. TaxID=2949640 RepID=UPI0035680AB6